MAKERQILIVEDTYFNRVLLESLLKEWGFSPILAISAETGLSILKSEKPSLILLDIMLPGMDGFMFLEEKRRLNNQTPVIVLSAKNDKVSMQKASEFGVLDYITKPYNPSEIKNKINEYFNPQGNKCENTCTP
jgi:DNA-binding response OmpR family regulator